MKAQLLLVLMVVSMPLYAIDMREALEKEVVQEKKVIKKQPASKKTSGVKAKRNKIKQRGVSTLEVDSKADINLIVPKSEYEHMTQQKDAMDAQTANKENNKPTATGDEKPKNCIKMLGGCFFGD